MIYSRACHTSSGNGEWGKRGVNKIASPWRKVWHPFVACAEWRLRITMPPTCGKNLCSIHTLGFEVRCLIHQALFVVWILGERSNPMWKIINLPQEDFSILHSPISNLREWALRHSRRACHVPILHSPRMERKSCDNACYLDLHNAISFHCWGKPFFIKYRCSIMSNNQFNICW